jgi:hypothetical protein
VNVCCFVVCLQITTVDKYQGQQNDFVLLSLVRTRIVGHLRDVRRLVVALSRWVTLDRCCCCDGVSVWSYPQRAVLHCEGPGLLEA